MLNHQTSWVVGVDLGATKIAAGLVSPDNQIIKKVYTETRVAEGPTLVVERISGCLDELRGYIPGNEQIVAIGVCCPGPVDHATGMVLDPPNMTGWLNVPLQKMLEERLAIPAAIEHDAKAAALGEFHFGAGRGSNNMIFVVVGTGVGAAIILDGQLYRGPHNSAGEIGHVTIDMNGPACSCGSNGCLEVYTAGPDLVDRFRDFIKDSGESCPANADGKWIAKLAAEGHPQALRVFEQAGQALGIGIATMAHLFDVSTYVIGGSVVQAGDLLLEPTRRAVRYRAYDSIAPRIKVMASPLGDNAAILGAAWAARRAINDL
jgi:glucokinase